MLPFPILVKNKLFQSPFVKWNASNWGYALNVIQRSQKEMVNTEFSKNMKSIESFINNIYEHRRFIINQNIFYPCITLEMIEIWDTIPKEELTAFIQKLAKNMENFDFDCRHDDNTIFAVANPPPRSTFLRRMNQGKLLEEKIFVKLMNEMPKLISKVNVSFPNGMVGSMEFEKEVVAIKRAKAFEVQYNPLDLEAVDWVLQRKSTSDVDRLDQLKKIVSKINFIEMESEFKSEIIEKETTLLQTIQSNLDELKQLQKEKDCLMNNRIHHDLINENCFPIIADIIKSSFINKKMDIVRLSDSESDTCSSWTDSWSSD